MGNQTISRESRKVTVLMGICGVLVIIIIILSIMLMIQSPDKSANPAKGDAKSRSVDKKYDLTNEQIRYAVESGISMEEINLLVRYAKVSDKTAIEMVQLRESGLSIMELAEKYVKKESGRMPIFEERHGTKGVRVYLDKNGNRVVPTLELSDFQYINYGMTLNQVEAELNVALAGESLLHNASIITKKYDLVSGGSVILDFPMEKITALSRMYYVNSKGKEFDLFFDKSMLEYR